MWWDTTSSTQGLLLTLCSGITLSRLWRTYWLLVYLTQVSLVQKEIKGNADVLVFVLNHTWLCCRLSSGSLLRGGSLQCSKTVCGARNQTGFSSMQANCFNSCFISVTPEKTYFCKKKKKKQP